MQARFAIAPQTKAAPQSPQPAGGERTAKAAQQFDAAIGEAKAAYHAEPQPASGSAQMPHGDTAPAAASRSDGSPTDAQVDAGQPGEATAATNRQRRAQSPAAKSTEPTAAAAPAAAFLDAGAAPSQANPSQAPADGTPAAAALDAVQTGVLFPMGIPLDPQSQDTSVEAGLEQLAAGQRGSDRAPTGPIARPGDGTDNGTVQPNSPALPSAGAAASEQGRSAPGGPSPDDFRALADRAGEARPPHGPASHGPSATAKPSRSRAWSLGEPDDGGTGKSRDHCCRID
jgi:hypothetical protein